MTTRREERLEQEAWGNKCRCGHPMDHHDANECWTTADGQETHEETSCGCCGYDPIITDSPRSDS